MGNDEGVFAADDGRSSSSLMCYFGLVVITTK